VAALLAAAGQPSPTETAGKTPTPSDKPKEHNKMELRLNRALRLAGAIILAAAALAVHTIDAHAAPGFSPGWTKIIPTGRNNSGYSTLHSNDVIFYKQDYASSPFNFAVTGYFDNGGRFYQTGRTDFALGSYLDNGWDQIIGSPTLRPGFSGGGPVSDILFYNSNGLATFAQMKEGGYGGITPCGRTGAPSLPPVKYQSLPAGWTQIVRFGTNGIAGYDRYTGTLDIGYFGGCFYSTWQTTNIGAGYDIATALGGNQVLFYAWASGNGLVGSLDETTGNFTAKKLIQGFAHNWTHILGDKSGHMLFYSNTAPGSFNAISGYVDQAGNFTNGQTYRLANWTDVIDWPDTPHIVFFYNKNNGLGFTDRIDSLTNTLVGLIGYG
jgi:hypothetical protein